MKHSLQLKLLVTFMLVITVTLGSVLWGISLFIKEQVLSNKQKDLLQKGSEIASKIQSFQDKSVSIDPLDDYLTNADHYIDARIWVIDKSRQIVAISRHPMFGIQPHRPGLGRGNQYHMAGGMGLQSIGGMRNLLNELGPVFDGQVLKKVMDQPYYGEKMVVVAVPIKQSDGSVSGVVLLNAPVTDINDFMQRTYYYIGIGGIVALFFALLMVKRLTRAIVRPLKAMQEAAGTMAKGDYTTRVDVRSSDEIGQLGNAFNSLAEDLANYMSKMEKTENLRRDFVANVSHELRTPLTIMRGYTDVLLDGIVDNPAQATNYLRIIQDETVRLERLVEDLLDLSRLQSETITWRVESIPLQEIADSVVHMLKQIAAPKNIMLRLAITDTVPNILGNGDLLTQLLLILLDNAIKYTPVNGHVTISITQELNNAILIITDSGTGIPVEDLPYIWERFYKVDKSHSRTESGAGLGLAIAKQIIDRHQAKSEVTSKLGQGTTFTIRFPVSKS